MDGVLLGGVQGESEVTRCEVTAIRVAPGPVLPCIPDSVEKRA